MSQTDKLLSNIYEYHKLLRFLNENYPTVLDDWKNENAGLPAQQQTQQAVNNQGQTRIVNR